MRVLLSIILLLLFSVWQREQPKEAHKPTDSGTQAENSASQSRNSPPPVPVVVKQVQIGQEAPEPDKNKTQKVSDFINSCSTAVIALFTVLTFLVFRGQLRATKVAERAWMVSNCISELPVYSSLGKQPIGQTFPVRFLQTNLGRTPAWITAMGSRANLLAQGQKLPSEPAYDWVSPFPIEGTVLPPKANIPQGADITLTDLSSIDNGAVTLYFYGVVRYRDVFHRKHETRYCYVFKPKPSATDPSPRDFYIGGPANYNEAS